MGPLGWQETVFIVVLALLLFGPKKLPELGRMVGKALTEFRRASNELKSTFDREMRNLERETESVKEVTNSYYHDSYNYDYSSYDSEYHRSESHDSPAIASSTESASAPQGAEVTPSDLEHPGFNPENGHAPAGSIASSILAPNGSQSPKPLTPAGPPAGLDQDSASHETVNG